jgi:glycogen phosphorylase
MQPMRQYEGDRWQYQAEVNLDRSGPFGTTVRVMPTHADLAAPQELGLQAVPGPTFADPADLAAAAGEAGSGWGS